MPSLRRFISIAALSLGTLSRAQSLSSQKTDLKDLTAQLKQRYDGKAFIIAAQTGLLAGEYQKGAIGRGIAGLIWYHFDGSIDVLPETVNAGGGLYGSGEARISKLNRLDARTFTQYKTGLNVTKLEKGEQVRVNKFYVGTNLVDLYLEPLDPAHLKDLDYNKASRRTSFGGGTAYVRVAGFGLRCVFFFDKDKVMQAGDMKAITDEIDKFLLPGSEADRLKAAEQNIEIDLGLSEEDVISRLGQPLKTIKVGQQKVLKYKDLTVTLKDGAVTDVKVE